MPNHKATPVLQGAVGIQQLTGLSAEQPKRKHQEIENASAGFQQKMIILFSLWGLGIQHLLLLNCRTMRKAARILPLRHNPLTLASTTPLELRINSSHFSFGIHHE